jgi:Mrp family chromosome partitioning ATPase
VLVGCGAAIVAGAASKRLDTDYDVAEKLGIEPLDVLPSNADLAHADSRAVRVQHLVNVIVRGQGNGPTAVTVAAASPDASATDLAAEIARQRAAQGVPTLLLDADIRRAGPGATPGLADLLASDQPDVDAVVHARADNLEVIGTGHHAGDPYELFDRGRLSRVLETLLKRADFVVVNAPALARAGEAQVIGDLTGGVLLALEAGTRVEDAREAVRVLDQVDATLIGTVLVERDGRRRASKSTAVRSQR